MKKHDLINEIRVLRADVTEANARLRAIEIERVGARNEITRLEERLAREHANLASLDRNSEGQMEDARYGALAAESLGRVMVDFELGVITESGLHAAAVTARHEAKRAAEIIDVEIAEDDGEIAEESSDSGFEF
ncbi:hypothetical protein [Pseudomonas sp.]|uniref:hypothetical protein n=1 Tax=Pseudomonas sp. TaxID=306 RepID=UPI0026019571|nr:hypothetical protein [Pseudomonas sp.]